MAKTKSAQPTIKQFHELSISEGKELAVICPWEMNGPQCGDEVKRGGRFFTCTRGLGHEDQLHVAHVPGPIAVASWVFGIRVDARPRIGKDGGL